MDQRSQLLPVTWQQKIPGLHQCLTAKGVPALKRDDNAGGEKGQREVIAATTSLAAGFPGNACLGFAMAPLWQPAPGTGTLSPCCFLGSSQDFVARRG